jgi:xanthine dehydrogenase accessory factor
MYDEFFSKAHELLDKGIPFAVAIVVRAEKPTSGKPGDKAIITPTGVMHGWIGGSCAQPTVINEAMKALAEQEPCLIHLSTDPDRHSESREGLINLPMTCFSGGTLEIYIEPQLPLPRLIVIGNLPVAQALIQLGKAMNYRVIAVDPDNEGAGMSQADEVLIDLEEVVDKITPLSYVVVASHGQYDELALEYALRSSAAYVALVASKSRAATVLDYLKAQGLTKHDLSRLKYPAGLDIQARRGDEIALSIMAEIVQRRRTAETLDVEALLARPNLSGGPTEAIDPVCGMAVQIEEAEHQTEYNGQPFYFCCEGCKAAFETDPEPYLAKVAPAGEVRDPVCGMTVEIAKAKYMSEYEGQLYYFCAAGCKTSFEKNPQKYLTVATTSEF